MFAQTVVGRAGRVLDPMSDFKVWGRSGFDPLSFVLADRRRLARSTRNLAHFYEGLCVIDPYGDCISHVIFL